MRTQFYLRCTCCYSYCAPLPAALIPPLLSPSRHLTLLCSEQRQPDTSNSLIMSQLKYQYRAPSYLTKPEVMKPCILKLNETGWGWRTRQRVAKSEAKAGAKVKSLRRKFGAVRQSGLSSVFQGYIALVSIQEDFLIKIITTT